MHLGNLKKHFLDISSVLTIILLILPGMIYFNEYNFEYYSFSFTWNKDQTKLAFLRKTAQDNYNSVEIFVWSKNEKNFQSIYLITSDFWLNNCQEFQTCHFLTSIYGSYFKFSFSPDSKILALIAETSLFPISLNEIKILIFNLSTRNIIKSSSFFIFSGVISDISWNNRQALFADDLGVINLFTNDSLYDYSSFVPISNPIINHGGQKVAMTIEHNMWNKTKLYSLLVIDLISKQILLILQALNFSFQMLGVRTIQIYCFLMIFILLPITESKIVLITQ